MKSIKPGRGPSLISGIVGIVMVLFGILWTSMAAQASGIFALFGVLWTIIAITITITNFKNATSKNRYSTYDIVDEDEEVDPLNVRFGNNDNNKYCPYCGTLTKNDYEYCTNCGKKLPNKNIA